MPIYEYRCRNGHTFEVIQTMSEDPVSECEVCDQPVERVFHPVAVHFKGRGFYTTDYGGRKGGGEAESAKPKSGNSETAGGDSKAKSSTP